MPPDILGDKRDNLFFFLHCVEDHETFRILGGKREVVLLHPLEDLRLLEVLPVRVVREAVDGFVHRDDQKVGPVGHDRPPLVHPPDPAERFGEVPLERDRLVGVAGVAVAVRDDNPAFRERRADEGVEVRRMVGYEEERLGDGIDLLGDAAADSVPDPGGARLPREDGIEVGEGGTESPDERRFAGAVDALDGDQQSVPLRIMSRGIAPRCTAVATIAPSNPSASSRLRSSIEATPPP